MQANKSSRVFLLASLVLGVLATIIAFAMLDRSMGQQAGPTRTILVAATDIRPGVAIDPDRDLAEWEVSADMAGQVIDADLRETLRGERTTRTILAGQPILSVDLGELAELRLSADKRALSIPARGPHAVGGHLGPGDYVTLMVTRPIMRTSRPMLSANPDAEDEDYFPGEVAVRWETTNVIAEPVKVLAVGPRLTRHRQPLLMADQYETAHGESQQTVTLEVTEEQARTILEQSGAGQLPLTLILDHPPEGRE